MLCGATITGVVVSVSYLLKELRCETPTTLGLLNSFSVTGKTETK
jgi:hypothetical protein